MEKLIVDLGMRGRHDLGLPSLTALHIPLVRLAFGHHVVKVPLSQQLGETFQQRRCHFNIAPIVVKVVRPLARRIRESREGVRKSSEDLITKRSLESVGVRRETIKNILRKVFETVFGDSCDGGQLSVHAKANSAILQDMMNSNT